MPVASRLFCLLALLLLALASPASAQGSPDRNGIDRSIISPDLASEQTAILARIRARIEAIEQEVTGPAVDDATLVDRRFELQQLTRRLSDIGFVFRPRIETIDARLTEIGPPPEDPTTEPAALAAERQSLTEERSQINTVLGEVEQLSTEVAALTLRVAQIRRDIFTQQLATRYDILSAFSPEVVEDFRTEAQRLSASLSSWFNFVIRPNLSAALLAAVMALLAAVLLNWGLRTVVARLLVRGETQESPPFISRLSVAFWSTLLPSMALAVFLAATWYFFDYFGLLREDVGGLIASLFRVVAIVFFVSRLSLAVFEPRRPHWRLIGFETKAAFSLNRMVIAMAVVTGLDVFLASVSTELGSPLSVTVARSFIAALIMAALILRIATLRPYVDAEGRPKGWSRPFKFLLFLLAAVTIISAFAGYIGFARFFSQQVVVTGAILATMYIGYLSGSAISEMGAFRDTMLGRHLDRRYNLDAAREDQLGLLAGILVNLLVVAVGVPLILLQWGFRWGDLEAWFYRFATEIQIGSLTISIAGILTGVVVFIVGFFLARGFQGWLDGKVMTRGRVDAGIRNSVSTAVGYAGVAIAGLIGLSVAGIDLSNLALVAGALSLGIGFGLQNIVNNFVSGLILLAERPFKVGDWIVAGQVSGIVSKISVRATEIETFQRQTVILPNSDLINAAVGNWTHRNRLARVDIPVRVAHGSNPRQVHDLLLAIARQQPRILRNPEPLVAFTGYTDTSLDFELRYFIGDIMAGLGIQNEVRFEIVERLTEAGISMPRPQAMPPYVEPQPQAAMTSGE